NSCFSDASVVVQQNTLPIAIVDAGSNPLRNCGVPDGQVFVNANGVTVNGTAEALANFTYSWTDASAVAIGGALPQPTTTVTGLSNGDYYVSVQKTSAATSRTSYGCTSAPFKVTVDDDRQYPIATFSSIPNSVCPGAPAGNGTITTMASENDGTIGTYSYSWTLNGTPLAPITATLTNASDGLYAITVTNTATSCANTFSYTLIKDQTLSTPNIVTVVPGNPTDCNPTGSATVTKISIGGTTTYQAPPDDLDTPFDYQWYASTYPAGLLAAEVNHVLPNQLAGNYFVLVKDLTTNCISTPVEVTINDLNIIYPDLSLIQTKKQISCTAGGVGSAELLATVSNDNPVDPNPTYTYEWFSNLNFTAPDTKLTSTLTKSDNLPNLPAGQYSITVLNGTTGCRDSAIYVIPNAAPLFSPELTLTVEPMLNCVTPDGAVFVRNITDYGVLDDPTSTTDIPDYPYSTLSFQSEYYTGPNPDTSVPGSPMTPIPFASKPSWTGAGLANGLLYTVKVTDMNSGCSTIVNGTIPDGRLYPVVEIAVDNPLINCDPARPNGQLSATADGLVAGYTYQWYSGTSTAGTLLPASKMSDNKLIGVGFVESPTLEFTVKVTNSTTQCSSDKTGQLTDGRLNPPIPNALVMRDLTSCTDKNGWVTANVGGQTLNYTFTWYDGSAVTNSPDFIGIDYFNRDSLQYTVTATDQITGCVSDGKTVKVNDSRKTPKILLSSEPSYCANTNRKGTGSLLLTVLNGNEVTLDSTTWYDENSNTQIGIGSQLYDLYPGNYRADAISTEGCTATGTVEIITEVLAYNLVSANNDGKNDGWIIDCIDAYPNNVVKIFNRAGILVYEARGYNNAEVMFKGVGEEGIYLGSKALPDGTYFYIIDKHNGTKPIVGYLELVR
ncbi:MAG TPA: gliding motility-associated C-terminal domain-containing protein, partial [Cyclobacteriaceae bacterium]